MLQHPPPLLCLHCPPHHPYLILPKPTETVTGFPIMSYPFNYMPQVMDVQNHMPSQFNLLSFNVQITYTGYRSSITSIKKEVLKSHSPFKIRQYSQPELNLQYKVSRNFSPPYFFMQPPLTIPTNNPLLCISQFLPPYPPPPPPAFFKNHPYHPIQHSLYTSAIFHLHNFA